MRLGDVRGGRGRLWQLTDGGLQIRRVRRRPACLLVVETPAEEAAARIDGQRSGCRPLLRGGDPSVQREVEDAPRRRRVAAAREP